MTMHELERISSEQSMLGEGPIWDELRNVLYYVDIEGRKIIRYDPLSEDFQAYITPSRIGFLALTTEDYGLVGLEDGIYKWQLDSDTFEPWVKLEDYSTSIRINDGKCGPNNVLWFGTMDLACNADIGGFYRLTSTAELLKVREDVCISNGLAWKSDLSGFYYIDTKTQAVTLYPYDKDSATIGDGIEAFAIPTSEGAPDGMTIDRDGMLWIAHYGGYQVARWNPETGEKIESIDLPAKNVTCCTFGGEELDELYITTQKEHMEDHMGGHLYRIKLPYRGYSNYRMTF
jgi:sugar lactone lactonase YvrE